MPTHLMRLVLASTSPRRRELLGLLAIPFDTVAPAFDEVAHSSASASDQAREFALGKARAIAAVYPDAIVIGSDTLIEVEHRVLGKPGSIEEARTILAKLRGRAHCIWTAVAVVRANAGFEETALSRVVVRMRSWPQADIEAYLATGESLDKAGAYAIQGRGGALIERIKGDYTAAVGLPLRTVANLIGRAGGTVPANVDDLYRRRPYANWSRFAMNTEPS